jgi:hypothetical protein
MEGVADLDAEDHDEPVEAGEEDYDGDEAVGHDVIAGLHLPHCLQLLHRPPHLPVVMLQLLGADVHRLAARGPRRRPGGRRMERIRWRGYDGEDMMERIPWRGYDGEDMKERIRWRGYDGEDTMERI